jgi:hypothetical protein
VRRNARLLGAQIPQAVWDDLREQGLLDAQAPVPAVASQ